MAWYDTKHGRMRRRRLRKGFSALKRNRANQRMKKMALSRRVPIPLKPHTFCERVIQEQLLAVNGAGLYKSFALEDIYNSVSYQKLFEYYKITKVVVTLRYKADGDVRLDNVTTSQPGTVAPNEANPVIWFKVDHNDISADDLDQMKASTRTKDIQFTNNRPKIEIVLKPAILEEAYKSTIASTYVPKWNQYLTTGDPTVPHYGIKMYATGPGANHYGGIVVTYKYYFTCKNNE